MATTATIPLSEYLTADYEVDCDYVDGELQERNVGEWQHSLLQLILAGRFRAYWREWKVVAATEQRVQVGARRYRVPDLCVMRASDRVDRIVQTAPLICIEVLSPEDRRSRVNERIRDYQQMGVEHIWIFDPETREAWSVQRDGTQQRVADSFSVDGTAIHLSLEEVWAELDEMRSGGADN